MNNMTNNDHRRTAYTMTKKQNEQQDKQRSQKDSLHNDQNKMNNMTNNDHRRTTYTMTKKQNEQHDKQRSQKDSLHNDQQTK